MSSVEQQPPEKRAATLAHGSPLRNPTYQKIDCKISFYFVEPRLGVSVIVGSCISIAGSDRLYTIERKL